MVYIIIIMAVIIFVLALAWHKARTDADFWEHEYDVLKDVQAEENRAYNERFEQMTLLLAAKNAKLAEKTSALEVKDADVATLSEMVVKYERLRCNFTWWLMNCVEKDEADGEVSAADLWGDFTRYCFWEPDISQVDFGVLLRVHGIERVKRKDGVYYRGIRRKEVGN